MFSYHIKNKNMKNFLYLLFCTIVILIVGLLLIIFSIPQYIFNVITDICGKILTGVSSNLRYRSEMTLKKKISKKND